MTIVLDKQLANEIARQELLREIDRLRAEIIPLKIAYDRYKHAIGVLQQIADMPRKTREQRLASNFIRFLNNLPPKKLPPKK